MTPIHDRFTPSAARAALGHGGLASWRCCSSVSAWCPPFAPDYLTLVSIHKPLGIVILVLALIRLVVRLCAARRRCRPVLPEPMKLAAHLSHLAFYALMIGMPLIGWAMLSAADYPVVVFRA